MEFPTETTRLLRLARSGDEQAEQALLPLMCDELHRLAERYMERAAGDHTLQPTALVNEAWLRVAKVDASNWESREHFLAVAASAMRSVLVDAARRRGAHKRGGRADRLSADRLLTLFEERSTDLLDLDDALEELRTRSERAARLVELRFFAGMTNEEAASVLRVSSSAVERDWRAARAWLAARLG